MTTKARSILAIDQGTTNTKAILVSETGQVVGETSRNLTANCPLPGWVEQDPFEIWHSTQEVVSELLEGLHPGELSGLAITNQRESVLIWERNTGNALGPCVVWQCRRTAPFCAELRKRGLDSRIYQLTGLTIDPLFSAGKARWLLDHIPQGQVRAESGDLCMGTVDSWLLWNLTGGRVHACDVTNASRTQLFNLHHLEWDDELLGIFDIPRPLLPEVRLSSALYGETIATGAAPAGIPIAALIGDSHASLFGHAGFRPCVLKATYGTGSSLMQATSAPVFSHHGLSTCVAWGRQRATYALEGNILVTGAAIQWLSQLLGLEDAGRVEPLAQEVPDTGGVYFVPAFVGLGAPHWKEAARGLITGITRGTRAAHVARAVLESIAYQVRDVFVAMQADVGKPVSVLCADGGATRNDTLMQFQADILGVPVARSLVGDVSALGAAYLAGLTLGLWSSEDEIASLPRPQDSFEPRLPESHREALYAGWQQAIARTICDM